MTFSSDTISGDEKTGAFLPEPHNPASLKRNFIWTVLGNAALAACQWATLVVIAKLGSVEMVGLFAYALAVALPIAFIVHLQLRTLYVTDLERHYPFAQMVGLRYAMAAIAAPLLFCILLLSRQRTDALAVIVLVCFAQTTDSISESYYAIAQRAERMDRIAVSQLARGLLSVSALAFTLLVTQSILWAAAAFMAGKLLVLIFYDAADGTFQLLEDAGEQLQTRPWARFRPAWKLSNQLRLFWVVLPIGIASVLILVTGNMPRYTVASYMGSAAVGIYAALSYLPASIMMIATALGNAAFARMSRDFHHGNVRAFLAVLSRSVAACAVMGLGALTITTICGRQLLLLLYHPEYAGHTRLLALMMVVGCVGAVTSCLGCAMSAAQQFSVQVPLFAVVTFLAFLGCHSLIPRYGLAGAAIASGLAMAVQLFGSLLVLWRAILRRAWAAAAVPLSPTSGAPLREG